MNSTKFVITWSLTTLSNWRCIFTSNESDKHYELLLIKHIWILLDSYPVRHGFGQMSSKELEVYKWLYGTVVGYGTKEEVMKVDYLTSSNDLTTMKKINNP